MKKSEIRAKVINKADLWLETIKISEEKGETYTDKRYAVGKMLGIAEIGRELGIISESEYQNYENEINKLFGFYEPDEKTPCGGTSSDRADEKISYL